MGGALEESQRQTPRVSRTSGQADTQPGNILKKKKKKKHLWAGKRAGYWMESYKNKHTHTHTPHITVLLLLWQQ